MEADERFTGRGVTIAFLDSGFYPHPDLTQPKNRVLCYTSMSPGHDSEASSYKHVDGTNFAAPVVAQMLEANPTRTPQQVKRILMETAERLPHEAIERQGWGAVTPAHAVAYALSLRR